MKTLKASVLGLTFLLSANLFAADTGTIQFDQDQIKKDPTFHCDLTSDNGNILSPTKLKLTADAAISLGTNAKVIESISSSDMKEKYFRVSKDEGGKGTITYSTNNGSEVVCAIGDGGRPEEYK
ncbi:MAG: hypothetical protein K0S27_1538 [Gammaproteobacteria bacterium]|nr:hypothetical protein [Gammaproteobacteria bacterium]